MPTQLRRPFESVIGWVFVSASILGGVSYLLPWGARRGSADCDCCDSSVSGLDLLGVVSGQVPLQWLGPLGLCMMFGLGAWILACPCGGWRDHTRLLPAVGFAVALWGLGITLTPVGTMGLGFCACLAGLIVAAWAAMRMAVRAASSTLIVDPPPVHAALQVWSVWKVRVAVVVLLLAWGMEWLRDSPARPGAYIGLWFLGDPGPWSAVLRSLAGAALLAFSAALTCGFSYTALPRSGSRAGLLATWIMTLLASIGALTVYASGAIGSDMFGLEVVGLAAIAVALLLDLAVAPFLLWRALLAEDRRAVEAELAPRLAVLAPGIRLDDRLRRKGIIP